MSDRELVLGRIRAALAPASGTHRAAPVTVPREYRTAGEHPPGSAAVLDLLADRLRDYKAEVLRCPADAIAATVAAALRDRGRVLVPAGLPADWLAGWLAGPAADGVRILLTDPAPSPDGGGPDGGGPLPVDLLDSVDAVVTGCAVAVAETGTIALDASPDQGRRAITLVPDVHLVVVRAEQVVQTVPEGIARLRPGDGPPRPLTLVSGPSATSDIELERVEGVHGPRTLLVVLADPPVPADG